MKKTKFTLKSENKKIVGFEFRTDFSGKKLPVIICSHGFMANQKMCKTYAMHFAEKGFIALTYDFCGGGLGIKSSWKMHQMSIPTEIQDLKDVISYVKTLDYADAENITLLGCSQGGFVSALVAAENKEPAINQIILFYPALCIPDDARKGQMIFAKFDPNNIPEKIKCGPVKIGHDFPALVQDMDVNKAIAPYEKPVLIIHGTDDKIVAYSYAVEAQKAYKNAKLVTIEGAGHGFKGENDKTAIKACDEFLGLN